MENFIGCERTRGPQRRLFVGRCQALELCEPIKDNVDLTRQGVRVRAKKGNMSPVGGYAIDRTEASES